MRTTRARKMKNYDDEDNLKKGKEARDEKMQSNGKNRAIQERRKRKA